MQANQPEFFFFNAMRGKGRFISILLAALVLVLILINPVSASDEPVNESRDRLSVLLEESDHTINIFYSSSCSACKKILPKIIEIENEYPEISFNYFDVYQSDENRSIMLAFGEKYDDGYPAYPVVFTGNITVLEGATEINKYIETVLKALDAGKIPNAEFESTIKSYSSPTTAASDITTTKNNELSIIVVILAGLADGINPCALAVLALLLAALANLNSRRKILAGGLAYTLAVFLFYILAGLGIMTIIDYTGFSEVFSAVAGIIALLAGILTFAGGIWERGRLSPGIPESKKPAINRIIEKASIPTAFILGMMVGLFELPCTGGIYIAILGLLSSQMTFYEGLPYLLVYNLMFVVPLIAIVFAAGFGLPPERIDNWRESNKRTLRIVIGLILIAMSLYILSGYIF